MSIFDKSTEKWVSRLLIRMDKAMAESLGPMYEVREYKAMAESLRPMNEVGEDNAMVESLGPMSEIREDKAMAGSLGRMNEVREGAQIVKHFREMKEDLENMKKKLAAANRWEKNIVSTFQNLVKESHEFCVAARQKKALPEVSSKLQLVMKSAKSLHQSISAAQLPGDDNADGQRRADWAAYFKSKEPPRAWEMSQDWLELGIERQIYDSEVGAGALAALRSCYDNLKNLQTRLCLLCFSIFPDSAILKKKLMIYWWIGEGLIIARGDSRSGDYKTAEEVGDEIFEELLREGLIIAVKDSPESPVVNRCKMNPWIRDMLVSVAREAHFFDFDSSGNPSDSFSDSRRSCLILGSCNFATASPSSSPSHNPPSMSTSNDNSNGNSNTNVVKEEDLLTVFNQTEKIIGFKPDWLSKLKKIEVLQLGRWHYWFEHHIEVEDDEQLFRGLGSQKLLKYLGLRGISRIFKLPSSISGLVNLEILDLKACHNLEKLPDISKLKRLTHLDLSECYLLESMPKGIAKLTSLQVLKGFVIGNSHRNTVKFTDLAKLRNLRRLSIYLGRDAVVGRHESAALKEMSSLRCLAITWGPKPKKTKDGEIKVPLLFPLSLPESLRKLDLRGFPLEKAPEWLKPSQLKVLEKLYIKGGELKRLESDQRWEVQILLLKFLKNFDMGLPELKQTFPNLIYLEKSSNFGDDNNITWSKGAAEAEACSFDEALVRPNLAAAVPEESRDEENVSSEGISNEGEITEVP